MNMKWWDKPLRISAVQCNYGEDSMSILKNHVVKRNFNTEQMLHLMAEGHMAAYEEELHGAKLDKYLEEAKKSNIKEIIYWNVHCVQTKYRDMYPEWIQLDKNKNEIKAYDTHYLICINSKWFDTYAKNLEKLCQHKIDGIFLDGPVFAASGCYCKACEDKFYNRYNKSIFDAGYDELLEFRVDSVTEFIRKTNKIVKSINPEILLYLNNSALRADVTGSNTRKVEPYVDMLGAEGGFVWVNRNSNLWHASPMAKYIETQAKGKPTVIFIAGDHKPHSYYMHTAEETKLLFAQSVANGANVWYGIHAPTYIMDTPGGRAAEDFLGFLAKNEEYYTQTKPVSKVALMWSMDSANYYSSSVIKTDFTEAQKVGSVNKLGNHYNAFMGFYEMLVRSHIQFEVVDEYNAQDGSLSKYDLLILPTCGCMSRATAEGIRKFVAEGGKLVSTFDTGFYDEKGYSAEKPLLADVMGIDEVKELVKYQIAGTGFMKVEQKEWFSKGLSAGLLPSPNYAVRFTPSDGTELLASFLEPMKGRYVALPESDFPGIIHSRFGKGESIYIGGTAGEFYFADSNPDYRRLVENIVNAMSSPIITTDAPGSVEIVLRYQEKENRFILHMINMTGEMGRPIEKIIPLNNVKVSIRLGRSVKNVKSITSSKNIGFKCDNGTLDLTIPEVGSYEVIVISYEVIVIE